METYVTKIIGETYNMGIAAGLLQGLSKKLHTTGTDVIAYVPSKDITYTAQQIDDAIKLLSDLTGTKIIVKPIDKSEKI